MKHYDQIEWIFYKKKVLSESKTIDMEEHLYTCDECMNIFISLIDDQETDMAAKSLSSDFTNNVMINIQNIKHMPKPEINKSNIRFKEMFIYYVAVASVAIVLTLGGFYSRLVDMVPYVAEATTKNNSIDVPNAVSNMSGKIVNRTSNFINGFQISNMKENVK